MFPNCIAPQLKIHLKSHACHILMVTFVKAGEGLGGTVAANLAAQHPRDFDHLVSFFLCENYHYDIGTGESQIDYNTITGYVKSNPMQRRAIEKSPIFSKKFSDSKFQTL